MVTKNDIFLSRGIEYTIDSEKNKFKNDEVVKIIHHKYPYSESKGHSFHAKAKNLINSSLMCPICDTDSTKKVKNRIRKILDKKDICYDEDVEINGKKFDFLVYLDKKVYIKYFSSLYYKNVLNEKPILKRYRKFCKDNSMNYYEVTYLNVRKKVDKNLIKNLKKEVKK